MDYAICIVLLQLCFYWLCKSDTFHVFVQIWIPYKDPLEKTYIQDDILYKKINV